MLLVGTMDQGLWSLVGLHRNLLPIALLYFDCFISQSDVRKSKFLPEPVRSTVLIKTITGSGFNCL